MKKLHFLVASVVGATALTATAENKPPQTTAEHIRVISADDVFDKDIVSSDERPIGELEYILIRTDDGKIDYVVIESEMQGSKDKLLLVPFAAIEQDLDADRVRLQSTMDKVSKAPIAGSEEELATLIQSDKMQQVDSYWGSTTGTPQPGAAPVPRAKEAPGMTAPTPTEKMGTPGERPELGESPMPGERPTAGAEPQPRPQLKPPIPETPEARTPGTIRESTTAQTKGGSYLLLGEHSHRILTSAGTPAEKLQSLDVVGTNHKKLGAIADVVIDVDSGAAAYALVSRGGFLGLGMNYVAVPLQAIEFTDQNELRLKIPYNRFNQMRGYMDDDVPRSVLRTDLEQVYKQFKITPYWKVTAKEEVATRES